MKKLKISDRDYEFLISLIEEAFLTAKSKSEKEKKLKELQDALKNLR